MILESNYTAYTLAGESFDVEEPINVTINGTEYTLPFNGKENGYCYYGAPYIDEDNFDFSEYPVAIESEIGYEVAVIYPLEMETPFTISASYMKKTEAEWAKVGVKAESTGELLFDDDVETIFDDGSENYACMLYDGNGELLALNYSSIIVEFDGQKYTLDGYKTSTDFTFAYPDLGPSVFTVGSEFLNGSVSDSYLVTSSAYDGHLKIWANSEPVNIDIDDGGDDGPK